MEFQRMLGTNVFDTFEKRQDTRYQEMKRYADTWGLDIHPTHPPVGVALLVSIATHFKDGPPMV
jgi:hypothetical protein